MTNSELAQQIAEETGVTHGEAADQIDEVVSEILRELKNGRPADFPGLGRLRRDIRRGLHFTQSTRQGRDGK